MIVTRPNCPHPGWGRDVAALMPLRWPCRVPLTDLIHPMGPILIEE